MWWLPESPNHKVAGVLYYTPYESIVLDLIGSLQGDDLYKVFSLESIPVIYGEAANGHHITLFGNSKSISVNTACSFSLSNYDCNLIIDGIHLPQDKTEHRYNVKVNFSSLSYWCPPKIIKELLNEDSLIYKVETLYKHTVKSVQIGDRLRLSLIWRVHPHLDYKPLNISCPQWTSFELDYKRKISFNSIWEDINHLSCFMVLATDREVACEGMEISFGKSKGTIHYITRKPRRKLKSTHSFLFEYKDIKESFADVMSKWFLESKEVLPIRKHLVKAIRSNRYFDSTDFLIIIYALEGYALRFINKKLSNREALNTLINNYKDVNAISSLTFDEKVLTNSRNYYSHFMPEDDRIHYTEGELFDETKKLKKLLQCCMLTFAGFDNQKINQFIKP